MCKKSRVNSLPHSTPSCRHLVAGDDQQLLDILGHPQTGLEANTDVEIDQFKLQK